MRAPLFKGLSQDARCHVRHYTPYSPELSLAIIEMNALRNSYMPLMAYSGVSWQELDRVQCRQQGKPSFALCGRQGFGGRESGASLDTSRDLRSGKGVAPKDSDFVHTVPKTQGKTVPIR